MPTELIVRVGRLGERKALESLQLRASLMWEEDREALLAHPDAIELPDDQLEAGWVRVGELAGQMIGFSVVLPRPDGDAELDGLFVEPERWGEGHGRRLLEAAAALALTFGAARLHVVANPRAEGFYRRCGFDVTGTAQTRFAVANTMTKSLI